jgi:hypothetical protein
MATMTCLHILCRGNSQENEKKKYAGLREGGVKSGFPHSSHKWDELYEGPVV